METIFSNSWPWGMWAKTEEGEFKATAANERRNKNLRVMGSGRNGK